MGTRHAFLVWLTLAVLVVGTANVGAQPKGTITLWYPAGDIATQAYKFADPTLFLPFEAANGVKVQPVAVDYDTMVQKIFAAAAARNVADILWVDMSWVPGFLKEDLFEPVPPDKAKRWLAGMTAEYKQLSDYGEGKMWGYPEGGEDIYGLTWNKQQFREAGLDPERPPQTWDELREYAKKLVKTDAAGNITRVGYAIRHVGNPQGVVHKHLWAIWGSGADILDKPNELRGGKAAFNNEGGLAALKLVHDMIYVDKSTSLSFPDPRAAFLRGIASMQISETVSIRQRQPREAPNMPYGSGWGMALPPLRKAGNKPVTNMNAWIYTVPRLAKNKEMAWKLIEWLNSPLKDYEIGRKYDTTPRFAVNWDREPFKSDAYGQAVRKMAAFGRKYPINLGMNGVFDALGASIQNAWYNRMSIQEALALAERQANQAIQDASK